MGYSLSVQPESSSADQADLAIQNNSKLLATCGTGSGFNLIRLNSGPLDQRLYAAQDANHNVTALIDTSGAVVERYEYDPYGKVSVLDTNWAADADGISDVGSIYLYQNLRFDPVTGLYHTDHREYGPYLGRWNRPDPHPSGPYVQGMNPVQFVGSNPVNRTDPSGLLPFMITPAAPGFPVPTPQAPPSPPPSSAPPPTNSNGWSSWHCIFNVAWATASLMTANADLAAITVTLFGPDETPAGPAIILAELGTLAGSIWSATAAVKAAENACSGCNGSSSIKAKVNQMHEDIDNLKEELEKMKKSTKRLIDIVN